MISCKSQWGIFHTTVNLYYTLFSWKQIWKKLIMNFNESSILQKHDELHNRREIFDFKNATLRTRRVPLTCALACSPTNMTSLVASCKGMSEMNRLRLVRLSSPSNSGDPTYSSEPDSLHNTIWPLNSKPYGRTK